MFDQTQIKQLIEAAEQTWYACPHQTCLIRGCPNELNIAHQTRGQKKCLKFLIECLMALKFYQTRPNTIEQDQTRSNNIKQGVQTVKCLVTQQRLKVFGRQTWTNGKCLVTKHHQTLFGDQTFYRLDTLFGAVWCSSDRACPCLVVFDKMLRPSNIRSKA